MRDAYLARLGIATVEAPTKAFLQKLQRAHAQTIPYENLDVLAGRAISLDVDALFRKLIVDRRGGYCFELNTLFGWLLRELGYEVEFRMGRVWLRDPEEVPPRNHGTHVAYIDGQALIADVGFGGRAPRRLLDIDRRDSPIEDGDAVGEPLRLVEAGEYGVMVQRFLDHRWANQFSLELIAAHTSDLEIANHYQATAPASHFRHHLFVGRFREDGRDGLFDRRLSRRYGAETEVEILTSREQMEETLRDVFGIHPEPHRVALTGIMGT
jgi:arylamine N-acetyltransferase